MFIPLLQTSISILKHYLHRKNYRPTILLADFHRHHEAISIRIGCYNFPGWAEPGCPTERGAARDNDSCYR